MPKMPKKIAKKDVPVGSRWHTVPMTNFHVVVIGHCKVTGKVVITRDGSNARQTKAKLERFNGMSGGYAMVK